MTDQPASQQSPSHLNAYDYSTTIIRGVKRRTTSPPWLARAAAASLSIASVGFVLLFVFIIEVRGEITLITQPIPMQIVLVLPLLIVTLTVATTIGALLAWRNRYWSLFARIHQTILALLGIGIVWVLATLGLLPL